MKDLLENAVLKVVTSGDPVLRQKAKPVTNDEILSDNMKMLIALMQDTMTVYDGVGLAAPQVNISKQIIVLEYKKEYLENLKRKAILERDLKEVPFQALFNPVLTPSGNDKAIFFEGCLSVPNFMGLVERYLSVDVEAKDSEGKPVTIHATGWHARILQHEIDHLNGTLYIDRVLTRSLSTNENYDQFCQGKSIKKILTELNIKSSAKNVQNSRKKTIKNKS